MDCERFPAFTLASHKSIQHNQDRLPDTIKQGETWRDGVQYPCGAVGSQFPGRDGRAWSHEGHPLPAQYPNWSITNCLAQ